MEQLLLDTMLQHMENNKEIGDSYHGFTKGKSYLRNLMAFYNGVTAAVDEGRAQDIIHMDLCKAVDNVLHDILFCKVERFRFNRWTFQQIKFGWMVALKSCSDQLNIHQKAVRSGCSSGGGTEMGIFNIFVGDLDTLSKLAADTKLCGAADKLEGREAIQRVPDRLEMGTCANLEVQQGHVQGPAPGSRHSQHKYSLGGEGIKTSSGEKDFRMFVDQKAQHELPTHTCSPEANSEQPYPFHDSVIIKVLSNH